MISENELQTHNNSATIGEPTPDVKDAVVEDSANHNEVYQEWLNKAADICGQGMKGDIDPTRKQAANLPVVNDTLASQLGLENISEMQAVIDEEDEAELNRMDEESRGYEFTAEDVGICQSNGSYAVNPALEAMWNNIENCKFNVERIDMRNDEAQDLIMGLESAQVIDADVANKLRERIPGSLDKVNMRMFTKLPSSIGYKMAHEGSLAGKIVLGGLVIAGSVYLIYKILSWTIEGIKAITKLIRRMRERRANYKRDRKSVV